MSKRFVRAGAVGLIAALALMGIAVAPASAATPVEIDVQTMAYATDGSGQITDASEFLYDSSKGNSPDDAYQIAYLGELDMKSLWQSYKTFRLGWMLQNRFDKARWQAKTFTGSWDMSFTVDASVVSVNDGFVDCGVLQQEIIAQNPSSRLGNMLRCAAVSYDAATGQYLANFVLANEDGSKVTGANLDVEADKPNNTRPPFRLMTPPRALFVQQSQFEETKTFAMVDPRISGQIAMDGYFGNEMPVTFDDTGDPVVLTMVMTQDALFEFESVSAGRVLPAEVLAQLPAKVTMIRDGVEVTPPTPASTSVPEGQGAWEFMGWTPPSAVMDGADIAFTGQWRYVAGASEEFAVGYTYVSDDGSEVPLEVQRLLPDASVAYQGDTVTPEAPAQAEVVLTEVAGAITTVTTWSFAGWSPASIVVDASDIEFVGTWSSAVETIEDAGQDTAEGGSIAETGGSGPGYLLAGAFVLVLAGGYMLSRRVSR